MAIDAAQLVHKRRAEIRVRFHNTAAAVAPTARTITAA